MNSFFKKLNKPVDNSPLVIFRIIFGLLITLEAWGAIATGWVTDAFINPEHNFPFLFVSWLHPLPGNGMYAYYVFMGLCGVLVMLGLYYRTGIILYTILWAGVYFMQKTHYNNHYYLLLILLFYMCLVPANRYASLDVKRKPELKQLSCPQWCIWLFIAQIAIVYFYGSVNKIYPDWVQLKPLKIWFSSKKDYFLVGETLQQEWFQYIVAYGGILFDLLIVPCLLWKKTRKPAFVISIFFHLFNSIIFQVGIFPYMSISWALFFFPPETSRKRFLHNKPKPDEQLVYQGLYNNKPIIAFLLLFLTFQAIYPLRHHFIKGNVFWTEEGHRHSWRMMLRIKQGTVSFIVHHPENEGIWSINPKDYLTESQANAVAVKPDMCWQFVQILKQDFARKGLNNIQIFAQGRARLNGGPNQRLYNPNVNLAEIEWNTCSHNEWLVPLKE